MSYVLGLDLGTSSLKGLLVDENGTIQATAAADYSLTSLKPGYSEQNPADWLQAAEKVIVKIIDQCPDSLEKLEGISFSGQMHSLVVLDADNQVLRDAILWNDVRTSKQCAEIMDKAGELVLSTTKNKALEGFTLPKIMWLQENEPEIWQQVNHVMLPKDYLGFWMTGQKHMDYSDAAGTLMLDVEGKKWSNEILALFDIPVDYLPPLVQSSDQTGILVEELRELFGFKNEVKVFAGGADNACAALGAGIVEEGIGMASIGTSGVFLTFEASSHAPSYAGALHYFNHAVRDANYSMGVTLSAGYSLSWFRDNFATSLSYEELLDGINQIKPGSNGLLFAPYLVGERTPYTDSQIRGSFIGLDASHTIKHLARAVLEGITFSLKDSQMLMQEVAQKQFTKIVSVGGGAKNKDWLQMQADIFDSPVVNLAAEEGPGVGAAMLAAIGLGWYPDVQTCAEVFVAYKDEFYPKSENVAKYAEIYEIYRDVYSATKEINHRLQAVQ